MVLLFRHKFLVRLIPILLGIYCFVFVLTIYIVYKQEKRTVKNAVNIIDSYLQSQEEILHSTTVPALYGINFLAHQKSVSNYTPGNPGKEQLLDDMINFARSHKDFLQVAYIDTSGNEIIRINRLEDDIELVKQEDLQNVGQSSYFIKTKELEKGDVYISSIELNVEPGEADMPNKGSIRYGTTLYNEVGAFIGVLILNQCLSNMFIKIRDSESPYTSNLLLVNKSGYWFAKNQDINGFMFDSLKIQAYNKIYQEVWRDAGNQDIGCYETAKELFVVKDASLVPDVGFRGYYNGSKIVVDDENDWKLILLTQKEDIYDISVLRRFFILSTITLFLIAAVVIYAFIGMRYKEKEHVNRLNKLNQELEAKIIKRTQQIERKNSELNNLNKELEAFTYSVSHDLRAPLRHIIGFVDLVILEENIKNNSKAKFYLENIKEASEDMSELIENLLNLSRIGRVELNLDTFDLTKMVEEAQKNIENEFENRRIIWSVAELPRIRADYGLYKQVWFNLFHNAVKYSEKQPESYIRVECINNKEEHIICIKDNGVGFDMNYVRELFKPFHRLHSKEEFEGTGIGLANVKRIVTRHGGAVWAESNNEGAAFYFTIPRH